MRVVGLTGSIACGKSTVSSYLRDCAFPVIDGDAISHDLTAPGGEALPAIRRVFGGSVFHSDGTLNRQALGQAVFSDHEALARLDSLMAPYLLQHTQSLLADAQRSGASLCFLEMPLLFEKGYDAFCDTVWTVWVPEAVQLSRLISRDGLSREEALSRIHAVLSSDEKASRSDAVIDNSGSVEATLTQTQALLDSEIRKAGPRRRRSERYTSAAPAADPQQEQQTAVSASASAGTVPTATPAEPEGILRPESSRRRPSERKVAWMLPVPLRVLLAATAFLLLVSFTALQLMNAYLARRSQQHLDEQQAIDDAYFLLYREEIEKTAEQYNLLPAYVAAIIRNESTFRPMAESSVGARGLMQLMPDTAEWIAHKLREQGYAFERMYDPVSNIRYGCWYLNYLSGLFQGDPVSVVCAYHAGQGEILGWLSNPVYSSDGITLELDRLPEGPTNQYARRVIRDAGIYQEKYFSSSDGASLEHSAASGT